VFKRSWHRPILMKWRGGVWFSPKRRLYKTEYHGGFLMVKWCSWEFDKCIYIQPSFGQSRTPLRHVTKIGNHLKHSNITKCQKWTKAPYQSLGIKWSSRITLLAIKFCSSRQALWEIDCQKATKLWGYLKEEVEFSYLCWSHKPLEERHSDGGINLRRPFRRRKQLSELWHVATMAFVSAENSDIAGTRWESGMILHRKGTSVKDEAFEVQ
jgi:hypothetical protein